ncbi:MAG: transglutaminase-like domain-containing protein [Bacteroidales bacterium]|nr:transglutaminase-like domain-containing protein [Bacteroidales bacterium]
MTSEDKIRKMEALVSLIDEPDPDVFRDISLDIHSHGTEIIPFLEHAWETQHLPEVQKRIESIIHQIQFDQLCIDLKKWLDGGGRDLLEGIIIVARYRYPDLQEDEIEYELAKLRKDIWIELNENLTALEQIKVFNYVFYEIHGFYGNITDYHNPENSFINKVIETRTGNPLSLGIIYMLLAQSLDLPVHGINLPEHFVLAYTGTTLNPDTLEYSESNILFYINAFSHGNIFAVKDIEVFLKQLKLDPKPSYFKPCTNKDIVLRMLHNLMHAYKKTAEDGKFKEIEFLTRFFD